MWWDKTICSWSSKPGGRIGHRHRKGMKVVQRTVLMKKVQKSYQKGVLVDRRVQLKGKRSPEQREGHLRTLGKAGGKQYD